MKTHTLILATTVFAIPASAFNVLRTNDIGYLENDIKTAVYMGEHNASSLKFEIKSPSGNVRRADSVSTENAWAPAQHSARIYFSSATEPGTYELSVKLGSKKICSKKLYIGNDSYSRYRLNEYPLVYLRQQRCGDNPVHAAPCHQHDGFLVASGNRDGEHFDVRGGWHDASDYLQYLPTSANTVYQLLFGYRENPSCNWADNYDASGRKGANGVPDVLDEAKWGLEWMMRMNPSDSLYFNQIADDRDHRYVGVPQDDTVDYGWGVNLGRPIYPVSGQPQGLGKYRNRSNGEASSVAKFASAFALGASIFEKYDKNFSDQLRQRSEKAFEYALAHPGASQTAPCSSPYFYEEDNWVDDMELAAAACNRATPSNRYASLARAYAQAEPTTPWMGSDTARHYQWYPFINLGHYESARTDSLSKGAEYYRKGLDMVNERALKNAFRVGTPFVWCSNNFVAALVTQAMLYRELTGDMTYAELETSARDWLFGLNPWGQTMIILPKDVTPSSPDQPHSAMTDLEIGGKPGIEHLYGGLVDGPVYSSIFKSLWGVHLRRDDRFKDFQGPIAVYHDDWSDYSTNEPTMDGTASLTYMLGKLCSEKK